MGLENHLAKYQSALIPQLGSGLERVLNSLETGIPSTVRFKVT
jgi:hypothetical protein